MSFEDSAYMYQGRQIRSTRSKMCCCHETGAPRQVGSKGQGQNKRPASVCYCVGLCALYRLTCDLRSVTRRHVSDSYSSAFIPFYTSRVCQQVGYGPPI